MLPTRDRIKHLIPLTDDTCLLFNLSTESIDHILFECPIAVKCWIKSPWQIRISYFAIFGYVKWFQLLLDDGDYFTVDKDEKQQILQYAVLTIEQM